MHNKLVSKNRKMRTRSRNDSEKYQRREALLDAAQRVFFEKGFERTSMDDIAGKAGFSRALLYVYFKDKKDIYRSLRIRSVEILRDYMIDHVDTTALGIKRVRQVGEAYYKFYQNEKDHFGCLSLNISLNNENTSSEERAGFDPESIKVEQETMQVMIDAIEAGMADGSIDPAKIPSPLEVAMFTRGCMHGIIQVQDKDGSALLSKAGIDGNALIEFALDQVTNSLAP